jgi:predicted small lipoprotein YifL
MGSNLVKYLSGKILMRCNVNYLLRRGRVGYSLLWMEQLIRVLGIVMISIVLLCGGAGCGRKGPLKPLKKEAPPYNFMHT